MTCFGGEMKTIRVLLATVILLSAFSLHSDVRIRQRQEIPMTVNRPAETQYTEMWLGDDKMSNVIDGVGFIVNMKQKKLYVLMHDKKIYYELNLPFVGRDARLTNIPAFGTYEDQRYFSHEDRPLKHANNNGYENCVQTAGFKSRVYKTTLNPYYRVSGLYQTLDLWMAEQVPFDWRKYKRMYSYMMQFALAVDDNFNDEFERFVGFPLGIRTIMQTDIFYTHTLGIDIGQAPKSDQYSIPKGYMLKEMRFAGLPFREKVSFEDGQNSQADVNGYTISNMYMVGSAQGEYVRVNTLHGRFHWMLYTMYTQLKLNPEVTVVKDCCRYTGKMVHKFNSGWVHTGEYVEGKKEGLWQEYDTQGRLHLEEKYQGDNLNGQKRRWDDKGELLEEISYKRGLLHGEHRKWMDGVITYQANYLEGSLHGKLYENFLTLRTGFFKNGVGAVTVWYEKSKRACKYKMKDLKRIGKEISWHINGRKERVKHYNDEGRLHGVQIRWDEQGKVMGEEIYENGVKIRTIK